MFDLKVIISKCDIGKFKSVIILLFSEKLSNVIEQYVIKYMSVNYLTFNSYRQICIIIDKIL